MCLQDQQEDPYHSVPPAGNAPWAVSVCTNEKFYMHESRTHELGTTLHSNKPWNSKAVHGMTAGDVVLNTHSLKLQHRQQRMERDRPRVSYERGGVGRRGMV